MSQNGNHTPPSEHGLNSAITDFGRQIFRDIGEEQPSAFNKNYWTGRIMEWSMTQPDFKTNMFRLVDVLPSLRKSKSIAAHVREYLADAARNIHGLIEWGVSANPNSLRAKLTSTVVKQSVRQMAQQFIAGETPKSALKELRRLRKDRLAFTVDLLGEYCLSEKEAEVYLNRYVEALSVFGEEVPSWKASKPLVEGHAGESSPICVSIKLSALYSQCDPLKFDKSVAVLSERLRQLASLAKKNNTLIYLDAEDTARNPIIYTVFKNVFMEPEFRDFPYPGIVLQAYTRDSEKHLAGLLAFARERGNPIAVRLVKGAYWDSETVQSNQNHWPSPLFGVKESSDANYEKLTRMLIDNHEVVLPAFGSHNIRSLSFACCYAEEKGLKKKDFELQMLYGMAEPIARAFSKRGFLVRLYVPLGEMIPGMGYLVRRLLENTSNESFLRHTFFDDADIEKLLREPQFCD